MKKFVGFLLGFLLVLSYAGLAGANLIDNGDFSAGLNDWMVLSNDDFEVKDGWGPYQDHLAFQSGGAGQRGRLIQKFHIPTSATGIDISFDYMANFGESGNGNPWAQGIDPSSFFYALINLDLNDEGLYKYKNQEVVLKTNESTGWTSVNMSIIFDGYITDVTDNARIRFEWNENDDWISNAKLDNVEINAIPIPGSAFLLVSGLIGLIGFRARSRR